MFVYYISLILLSYKAYAESKMQLCLSQMSIVRTKYKDLSAELEMVEAMNN